MAGPTMQKVSTLVSKDIGNYLVNSQTWNSVMYNVLQNGLIGNGTTNDTAALQTLINTAIAAGRKAIFFPHTATGGTYFVTALTNADQVVFFGDNASFVGGYQALITQLGLKDYFGIYRQAMTNGNFDIWQRGTTSTNPATSALLSDRWLISYSLDGFTLPTNIIHSRQSLTTGDITGSYYFYRINPDGAGSGIGVSTGYAIFHRIEHGTRYLCGSENDVTVSFYAKSSITNKRIGISISQRYGTGGSPSASENLYVSGQIITLTSSWTRYTLTFPTNTLVGKTFGSNNDDYLQIGIHQVWGTTEATTRFNGGTAETFVGSGNIDIAQVQVCAGNSDLPFQPRTFSDELSLCQRYCYVSTDSSNLSILGNGSAASTTIAVITVPMPQQMRIQPTLTATASEWRVDDGAANVVLTAIAIGAARNGIGTLLINATVAAGLTQFRPYVLTSTAANIKATFDAEL